MKTWEDHAYERLYDAWEVLMDSNASMSDSVRAFLQYARWKKKVSDIVNQKRKRYAEN